VDPRFIKSRAPMPKPKAATAARNLGFMGLRTPAKEEK